MSAPARYAFGEFVLDRAQKCVLRADGAALALPPRLFDALLFFVESPGHLLEKDALMRALWPGLVVEENNLSQVVAGLRRALGDDAQTSRFIQTVPRRGFRFVAPVRPLGADGTAVVPPPSAAMAGEPRADTTAPAAAASAAPPERRRWLARAALVGGIAAAGLTGWFRLRDTAPASATTLAVLPFKPVVGDERDELLEIGLADNLSARLSALPGLAVRSTSSVLRYAGAGQDPQRAARDLDVDWIVDGTLLRRGEQLRATVRLLRSADGIAAWAGSFDAQLGSVFEVQDEIAARVQQALAAALHREAAAPEALVELGGTRNTEAYQLYLAASFRSQDGSAAGIARAIGLLQRALELDPNFALGWTELAWIHRRRLWNADALPAEAFAASNQALARALETAPQLPRAIAGLGFARYWFDYDWPAAEAEFRRALARNASVVEAHLGLAYLLLPQGRLDDGWIHMRRARELDPMSPILNAIEASYLIEHGAFDEGARRLDVAFALAPQLWHAHIARSRLLLHRGQPQEAIAALRQAVQSGPGTSRPRAVLAAQLAALGQTAEARAILDALRQRATSTYVPPTSLAMVHAALGEPAAALDALDEAYRRRDARLVYLKDDPSWRPLYGEPRFAALKSRLKLDGLPRGLNPI